MKKEFELEFCFKGSRTYVHGTDIFTKLTGYYGNNIDLVFHAIVINGLTFFTEKPEGNEVKVTLKCQKNGKKIKLFGIENNSIVNCRYEYNEEKIIENSVVDIMEKNICLNSPTEFSFIEHIVAMNKALLEKLFNDISGKWYFTRLQLNDNIHMSDVLSLQLIFKSNFQFKLTKSALIVNNVEVGFIYFSLIPKDS